MVIDTIVKAIFWAIHWMSRSFSLGIFFKGILQMVLFKPTTFRLGGKYSP